MSVIIIICKILGILLLSLLCIFLLLLFLLLFVPVGYMACGESDKTWKIQAKLHWLFSAVSFHVHYNGESVETFFRLFGVRLKKKEEKKAKNRKNDKGKQEREVKASVPESEQDSTEDILSDVESLDALSEKEQIQYVPAMQREAGSGRMKNTSDFSAYAEPESKKERFSKKMSDRCQSVKGKTQSAVQKTGDFKKKLSDKANQKAFSYIWKELVYLLKHMRFRRQKTAIEFSAGDPAKTGLILGVLSMFPVLYRENSNVSPDFMSDAAYVRGRFWFCGHVRLVHLAVSTIRLFIKKEFRYFMKNFIK